MDRRIVIAAFAVLVWACSKDSSPTCQEDSCVESKDMVLHVWAQGLFRWDARYDSTLTDVLSGKRYEVLETHPNGDKKRERWTFAPVDAWDGCVLRSEYRKWDAAAYTPINGSGSSRVLRIEFLRADDERAGWSIESDTVAQGVLTVVMVKK